MVGWNYRLTEMQSAIGLAELDRMDNWNMPRRRRNAHIIMDALADEPLVKFRPIDTPERQNGWFAYPTYEPHHCDQIGAALKKVIRAYAR